MAKKGLDIKTIQPVLRDVTKRNGWSLCVGAGTSVPALAEWYTLVELLIKNNCSKNEIIDIDVYRKMDFSPEAMIQAVQNHMHLSDKEFIGLLSDEIYRPIRTALTAQEWDTFVKIHETEHLSCITKENWATYSGIIDRMFATTSANLMAKVVIDAVHEGVGPRSILSFNVEAVFLTLLNFYYMQTGNSNRVLFDRIANSIHVQKHDRIPYFHCHGVIPINGYSARKGHLASDKLVLTEDNYLELANNSFSWQATSFIDNCMNRRVVFCGVSLTDANMRRWLSWIHANKMAEFKENGLDCKDATEHFWIRKKPNTIQEKIWLEESVAHLGVRLVWIDEWNQTGKVLKRMLGL